MNIGPYTFAEFKDLAAKFHGYPAPGLLIGGYMVELAKRDLPEGTLFEAMVESKKCLPDAVQLLTLCSTGNNWMKVLNLGRYAVALYDKYTGEGFRVHLDVGKLGPYPEIRGWFLKEKPKKDQDTEKLLREIETAGENICTRAPIRIRRRFLGHGHMEAIGLCPICGESYPKDDGPVCRGCQGEAPYAEMWEQDAPDASLDAGGDGRRPGARVVPVEEAVGKIALHDMTRIVPGEFKGAAFLAGQAITAGDVCRLQQMGRFSLAVLDESAEPPSPAGEASGVSPEALSEGKSGSSSGAARPLRGVHENEAAEAFARRMAGRGIAWDLPPREGKINFRADLDGLFSLDVRRLNAFNMVPDVMAASRQDGMVVTKDSSVAATRVIPLYIAKACFAEALGLLERPLFSVLPLRRAKMGVLVTGTEIFKGLIEDKFIPVITAKAEQYHCEVVRALIAPDDKEHIRNGIADIRAAGADLLVTTGGLSVDPDDVTRAALVEAGLCDVLHGAPVLPGSMSLVGRLPIPGANGGRAVNGHVEHDLVEQPEAGEMQVIGVPACALYFKTTLFDALLPRLLAGRRITRPELAALGHGGFCMNCKVCTWPKCFFLK